MVQLGRSVLAVMARCFGYFLFRYYCALQGRSGADVDVGADVDADSGVHTCGVFGVSAGATHVQRS